MNLRKLDSGSTFIALTWDIPTSNGGSPITDYKVYWDLGSASGYFELLTSTTGNQQRFNLTTDIISGAIYTFKVVAINVVGTSNFSSIATITAARLPGKPGTPVEYSSSTTEIKLRWTYPVLGNGGANITDYKVYWDQGHGDGSFVYLARTNGYQTLTVNSALASQFTSGLWFTFRVTAINSIGESEYS